MGMSANSIARHLLLRTPGEGRARSGVQPDSGFGAEITSGRVVSFFFGFFFRVADENFAPRGRSNPANGRGERRNENGASSALRRI